MAIYDTPSQGTQASKYIIKAIKMAEKKNIFDVIVLTRGGGSMEDLWCFNDEELANVIFECKTPILSAIGHEIDFTICDFVSDIRAATPSEAAEILFPDQNDLFQQIDYLHNILKNCIRNILANKYNKLERITKHLTHPKDKILIQKEKLNSLKLKLKYLIKIFLENEQQKLKSLTQKLEITSVQSTLERGYAIIKDNKNNNIIQSINTIKNNEKINITLKDGNFKATVNQKS